MWLGREQQALAALDHWLANAPPNQTSACLHGWATRAHLLGHQGRWREAAAQLAQLTTALPNHAIHHFNWGYALQQTGAWVLAEQAFRRAVCLSPQLDVAWYGLGDVLQQQGQVAAAEQAWVRQSELQPFCPDGLVRLVCLHAHMHQWPQAQACLNRLKGFDPRRALALEPLLPPGCTASEGATP